jgi:hypothetical protein
LLCLRNASVNGLLCPQSIPQFVSSLTTFQTPVLIRLSFFYSPFTKIEGLVMDMSSRDIITTKNGPCPIRCIIVKDSAGGQRLINLHREIMPTYQSFKKPELN